MLQRLPIALVQVKAGNKSGNLQKWNHTYHMFFVTRKKLLKKYITI